MRLNWNKKYTTIAVYTLIVIGLSILFSGVVLRLADCKAKLGEIALVFIPFIIGGVMAYLLNFVLVFYESKILRVHRIKESKRRKMRGVSLFLTYLTVGAIVYAFLHFISPQLTEGVTNFVEEFPDYIAQLTDFIDKWLRKLNLAPNHVAYVNERVAEMIEGFVQFIKNIVPILLKNIVGLASSVWNVILGVIISVYLLGDKERFVAMSKKLVFAIFNEKHSGWIVEIGKRANHIFGRFLVGTIIDSAIVGAAVFISMFIFRIPYATLIAFLVGISNVIPFFGPFIGAVPSVIIIFFVSPLKALWFLIIILVIQQVDGNVIAPKILGEVIGLAPFWVLFATLVFGNLFGIIGMVIGVPVFALIHSIVKDILEARLKRKSLPIETEDYMMK